MGSISSSTRSPVSAWVLVNPQATWVLLPMTSAGWPGQRDAVEQARLRRSRPRRAIRAPRDTRCSARGCRGACRWRPARRRRAVSCADTAQLLLPSAASPWRGRPRVRPPRRRPRSRRCRDRSRACRCACAAGCRRRGPARRHVVNGSPTIGESHSVPRGASNSNIAGGSTSCIVASVDSYAPSGPAA